MEDSAKIIPFISNIPPQILIIFLYEISRDNEKHTENPLGPIQMEHLSYQNLSGKSRFGTTVITPLAALPFSGAGG